MPNKSISSVVLIALMVSSLVLFGTVHFAKAQSGTSFSGMINADTTWAKANSPYTLTGNVLVDENITLTIELGVTVSFNSYFMNVSGTLLAIGSQTENIIMTSSGISNLGE
jgi:hypothetical protein